MPRTDGREDGRSGAEERKDGAERNGKRETHRTRAVGRESDGIAAAWSGADRPNRNARRSRTAGSASANHRTRPVPQGNKHPTPRTHPAKRVVRDLYRKSSCGPCEQHPNEQKPYNPALWCVIVPLMDDLAFRLRRAEEYSGSGMSGLFGESWRELEARRVEILRLRSELSDLRGRVD